VKKTKEPPKVEKPTEVRVTPAVESSKGRSSSVWSRRAWSSREDKTEGKTKSLLGGIRSRLGQTESSEQENTEPGQTKKRLGWRKAGTSSLLKDDKTGKRNTDIRDMISLKTINTEMRYFTSELKVTSALWKNCK